MGQLRSEHERQLDDISAQLMHFEASLRTKEKQIEEMLAGKEQVTKCKIFSLFSGFTFVFSGDYLLYLVT